MIKARTIDGNDEKGEYATEKELLKLSEAYFIFQDFEQCVSADDHTHLFVIDP